MINSFLDKFLRWLRFKKIVKYIPANSFVCDIGCGSDAYLLRKISGSIKHGIGLDKEVENHQEMKLELKRADIFKCIPLENKRFDVVTMIATLEHLDYPREVLKETYRVLKNNGRLIIIAPTPLSKPVLEILAYIRLINKNAIQDHKNYFWPREVQELLLSAGFKKENIKGYFFEFFLNSLITAQK